MAKRKHKKENLEHFKLFSKVETKEPFISFSSVFESSFSDLNFYSPTYGQLKDYFYRWPELLTLWMTRRSFVSRNIKLKGDSNSPQYKFISENLTKLDLAKLAKKIQRAVLFGLSVQEIVWEVLPNGKILPKQFLDLPLSSFRYKDENLYWNSDAEYKKPIDKRRVLVSCWNPLEEDSPFGLMRVLLSSIKKALENDDHWQVMVKKNTAGILVGFLAKGNDSDEKKTAFAQAGKALQEGKSSSLGMSNDESIQWIESRDKGSQSTIYQERSKSFKDLFAKVFLGQTLTTDSGANASYAIGEVHANTQSLVAVNDMTFVTKVLNGLFRLIIDMNFAHSTSYVEAEFDSLNIVNKALAERDKTLWDMGVRFRDKYFVEHHNLSKDNFFMGQFNKTKEERVGK